MNWKKYLSIIVIAILIAVNTTYCPLPVKVYASEESTSQNNSSESGDDQGSGSESGSGGSSDSDSGSSGSSSDSDSSAGDSSGDSTDSSGTSDESSDSQGDSSSESGKASQDGDDSEKSSNSSDSEEDTSEESEKKTTSKKTVVEDDSDGRDYEASEDISSGNLTFTIVAVSKNGDAIDKKIKKLQKQKKKLKKERKSLLPALEKYQAETSDIEAIYSMIQQQKEGVGNVNFYLTGYSRDSSYAVNENKVIGLDRALSKLAKTYHNTDLSWWLDHYSTEIQPLAIQPVTTDSNQEDQSSVFSNASSLLKNMKTEAQANTKKYLKKVSDIKKEIDDINDHIKSLKKKKEENTIDIDSRLVEYKDEIPDQAVEFLNAVVAKEGTPYVWGADGPNSFDCSGLVSYGLRQCGAVSSGFRWTSIDFATQLQSVSFAEAKPGDLVWKPGHIAIYIDANTVFEAPYTGANVRFTSCSVSTRFRKVLRWWSEN